MPWLARLRVPLGPPPKILVELDQPAGCISYEIDQSSVEQKEQ